MADAKSKTVRQANDPARDKRVALFPGSFDPASHGHIDVINRAAKLFDEVIVAVGNNPEKIAWLDADARVEVLRKIVANLPNVRVQTYTGLTVDCARKVGASVILRGLRSSADLHFEFQTAMTNSAVAGVETIFLLTDPRYAFVSSSLIRQVASAGGDVSSLVPQEVLAMIRSRKNARK